MTPLNIVARMRARPEAREALGAALQRCVGPSRAEPGNVNYDLHRHATDRDVFVLYEGYAGQDALDTHRATPHFQELLATVEPLLAEPFSADRLLMLSELAPPSI